MYNVIDVAKYIILFCKRNGYSINNLKLQKLLYFVQAQFLVCKDMPAFSEDIEAWDFGPVVPEVYRYFEIWGNSEIPMFGIGNADQNIFKEDQKEIDEILSQCAPYSATALVEITHHQSPWIDTYKKYCHNMITKKVIKEYFYKKG